VSEIIKILQHAASLISVQILGNNPSALNPEHWCLSGFW